MSILPILKLLIVLIFSEASFKKIFDSFEWYAPTSPLGHCHIDDGLLQYLMCSEYSLILIEEYIF